MDNNYSNRRWTTWQETWARLKNMHASLHVYLFERVYALESPARKKSCREQVQILVVTTSYAKKFLAAMDVWHKSFKHRPLQAVLIDEAHQERFVGVAALLGTCPRAETASKNTVEAVSMLKAQVPSHGHTKQACPA